MNATWFDRLARDVARGMSRREAVRLVAGATATAVFGSWLGPSWAMRAGGGVVQDPECSGTRTFFRPDCKHPVPKKNYKAQVNGCGPEGGVFGTGINAVPNSPLYLADFTPACNGHDEGYSTCNRPKDVTDRKFYHSMLSTCGNEYPGLGMFDTLLRVQCKHVATNYHTAVSTLGGDAFKAGQAGACDCCDECPGGAEKCVPQGPLTPLQKDSLERYGSAGRCCKNGDVCENGICCTPCLPGWTRCPVAAPASECQFGCCNPASPVCCPTFTPGDSRCCKQCGARGYCAK